MTHSFFGHVKEALKVSNSWKQLPVLLSGRIEVFWAHCCLCFLRFLFFTVLQFIFKSNIILSQKCPLCSLLCCCHWDWWYKVLKLPLFNALGIIRFVNHQGVQDHAIFNSKGFSTTMIFLLVKCVLFPIKPSGILHPLARLIRKQSANLIMRLTMRDHNYKCKPTWKKYRISLTLRQIYCVCMAVRDGNYSS